MITSLMSILLSCQNISKRFGPRPLFEGLSFGLFKNERTGLIGPNGTGKSTLLKILAELETPDEGGVVSRRGLKVRYLAQQQIIGEKQIQQTVRAHLIETVASTGLIDYEVQLRVDAGLEGTGFNPDQQIGTLSGGWRKRLAILGEVLAQPDLLLLDEPTNHLDLEGVRWLETFLAGQDLSFLVVTHDRRFLETVCNRVIEIGPGGVIDQLMSFEEYLTSDKIKGLRAALYSGVAV